MPYWLTAITVDPAAFGADRETLRLHLEKSDIESRPVLKPMHLQPVFRECRIRGGSISAGLFDNGLCLPSGSSLETTDLDRVLGAIRSLAPAKVAREDPGPCNNPNVA